jgi:hypothetical protein
MYFRNLECVYFRNLECMYFGNLECVYFRNLEHSHRLIQLMQFAVSHKLMQLVLLVSYGLIFS